ncbi:MAG: methyl-accepting chemotaxis protein [Defluviitaleaceae bacterium]|nr:methyl-accepting chemotaxis protein [Defluviitaleaceae bacterium]
MFNLKLKGKIILPAVSIAMLLAIAMTVFSITQFSSYANRLLDERVRTNAGILQAHFDDLGVDTNIAAAAAAADPGVIQAIQERNTEEMVSILNARMQADRVAFYTVLDHEGIVWARTHQPWQYGDPMTQAYIGEVIRTGQAVLSNEPGNNIRVSVRTTAPIFETDGSLVGLMSVGIRWDQDELIDQLTQRYGAYFTVFHGREAINTSLRDRGSRLDVSTLSLPPNVASVLLDQGREYFGIETINGISYGTYYMPIFDFEGRPFAVVTMSIPRQDVVSGLNNLILGLVAIGIVGVLLSTFAMFFIGKRITRPVKNLVNLVSEVRNGNMNVNINNSNLPQDEIGMLTNDVYGLVDVIKGILDDLSKMKQKINIEGDFEYRINANKYTNSFKDMIINLHDIIDGARDDVLMLIIALNNISDGNFDIEVKDLPGKKMVLPNTLRSVLSNIKSVTAEVGNMIDSIAEKGDLSFQIDANNYKGDWRKIMDGLNHVAEAINEPLQVIEMSINAIEEGNFDLEKIDAGIAATGLCAVTEDFKGSFKTILHAFDKSITSISSYIYEISEDLKAISSGDLTTEITREYVGDFSEIKESLNIISVKLRQTMSEISTASEQVLTGAKQISMSAQDLATGAHEQASSVEELNAMIDVINQQTQQNAQNATEASELSNTSTTNAIEGNKSMSEMLTAMAQIKESSYDISKIIKVIDGISFQTNLLALNAAVEAARAGEQGKGFSVVAEEVRNLAGRSKSSASETTNLIETSISRVESGSGIAESTSHTLNTIVSSVAEVSELVGNISEASKEQAEAIAQVSSGLSQISKITQSNSAVSTQTAAASEELSSQAELLQQLVSYFKL